MLGLVAVILVNSFLTGAEERQQSSNVETVKVAVATTALPFGSKIGIDNVRFQDWPRSGVPSGAILSASELSSAARGQVVLRAIAAGEPILKSKLSGEGGRASLSALLSPDMRAASIRITDVASVAGFALPGDRVDVVLAREINGEDTAHILLQNVRLVAIDQNTDDSSDKPTVGQTATLEVTPQDAQKLALGSRVGLLSLVLRPSAAPATTVSYSGLVRTRDLLGGSVGPALLAQRPQARTGGPSAAPKTTVRAGNPVPTRSSSGVEVVRGTNSQNYEVNRYGGV
jgi:pilus assembly protein CpaB